MRCRCGGIKVVRSATPISTGHEKVRVRCADCSRQVAAYPRKRTNREERHGRK